MYKTHGYDSTVFGKDFNFPSNLECFRAEESALYLAFCLPFQRQVQLRVQLNTACRKGSLVEAGYSNGHDRTVLPVLKKECAFLFFF